MQGNYQAIIYLKQFFSNATTIDYLVVVDPVGKDFLYDGPVESVSSIIDILLLFTAYGFSGSSGSESDNATI